MDRNGLKSYGLKNQIIAPALQEYEMGEHATQKEEIWKKVLFVELIMRGHTFFPTVCTDTWM